MSGGLRVDKWLWYARFCKSRSLAQAICERGQVRINGDVVSKPNRQVRPGDGIAIELGTVRRHLEVIALGTRRGPASEAAMLYVETAPPEKLTSDEAPSPLYRPPGSGRPTKKERRSLEKFFGVGRPED